MKKRSLHSLFACLGVSTLASYGAQQALCLAPQTALDTTDRLQKKIEHHEDSN